MDLLDEMAVYCVDLQYTRIGPELLVQPHAGGLIHSNDDTQV